jgi:hypothetical protein
MISTWRTRRTWYMELSSSHNWGLAAMRVALRSRPRLHRNLVDQYADSTVASNFAGYGVQKIWGIHGWASFQSHRTNLSTTRLASRVREAYTKKRSQGKLHVMCRCTPRSISARKLPKRNRAVDWLRDERSTPLRTDRYQDSPPPHPSRTPSPLVSVGSMTPALGRSVGSCVQE